MMCAVYLHMCEYVSSGCGAVRVRVFVRLHLICDRSLYLWVICAVTLNEHGELI